MLEEPEARLTGAAKDHTKHMRDRRDLSDCVAISTRKRKQKKKSKEEEEKEDCKKEDLEIKDGEKKDEKKEAG